jgi:segregation and condensation protein B
MDETDGPDSNSVSADAAPAALSEALRLVEAAIFASAQPVSARALAVLLPDGVDPDEVLAALAASYAPRGVNLVQAAGA